MHRPKPNSHELMNDAFRRPRVLFRRCFHNPLNTVCVLRYRLSDICQLALPNTLFRDRKQGIVYDLVRLELTRNNISNESNDCLLLTGDIMEAWNWCYTYGAMKLGSNRTISAHFKVSSM